METTAAYELKKVARNKKVKTGPCIFPFKYKWKTHSECIPTKKGEICATSVTKKRGTLKTYGYCKQKGIKRKTLKLPKKLNRIKVKVMTDNIQSKSSQDKKKTQQKSSMTKIRIKGKKPKIRVVESLSLNKKFIDLLGRLEDLMKMQGEVHRARAYQTAAETIMAYPTKITSPDQLKGLPGIGTTILKKFDQFLKTGTLAVLEREKGHPRYIFAKIFGVGPKKALELTKEGLTNLEELRIRKDELLNNKQKVGLRYYEDILKRIPRDEVKQFDRAFKKAFAKVASKDDSFEIVGSYRRGAPSSGDIDVIITNREGDHSILDKFITELQKEDILTEILSKGKTKSLTIGKLPGTTVARRLDFMFAEPSEYAFSTLYFTGSKAFNVVQRKRANDLGYTMNEHGLYHWVDHGKRKKKGSRVDGDFPTERSIFDFLGLKWKSPIQRTSGRAVILKTPTKVTADVKLAEPEKKEVSKKATRKKIRVKRRKVTVKVKLKKPRKKAYLREQWAIVSKEGMSAIKVLAEDDLCAMLRFASDAYYNDKPVVTDNLFDIVKEYGQRTYSGNPCFHEIGAPTNKKKVKLPYFLGSMEKIKPDTAALPKFLAKYPGSKVISAKLDGISALYTTEGKRPQLLTRGRAVSGLDISYMIPYLELPKEEGIAIRGELIVPQKVFESKYSATYKNPRNMVSGIVNSKQHEAEKWKDLDFVGYEVINPRLKPSAQLEWLHKHGVITVLHEVTDKISNELLSTLLVEWRENYTYEIDGLVVVDDKIHPRRDKNPDFAFAFKMVLGDQIAEVKVVDVIWTSSKDHYLKPVVQVEPVRIRGADIEFATGYNARFIKDNMIGVGAVIQLIRSGDVIPKIETVIQPAEQAKMPTVPWHWNETKVDAISDLEDDPGVRQKSIEFFFKKLDIKGLGPGNVKRMIKTGFDTVPKILNMTKEDMLTVEGVKERTATKLHTNIRAALVDASLVAIASASNVFGRGLGSSILRNIIHEYPNIIEAPESADVKVQQVSKVENVGLKRARVFVKNIPAFISFLSASGLTDKLKEQVGKNVDKSHPLFGKRIVITGFTGKTLKKKLAQLGAKVGSSVNDDTFLVVVKDLDAGTSKADKAREKGIELVTVDDFRSRYVK